MILEIVVMRCWFCVAMASEICPLTLVLNVSKFWLRKGLRFWGTKYFQSWSTNAFISWSKKVFRFWSGNGKRWLVRGWVSTYTAASLSHRNTQLLDMFHLNS